ncbi:putative MFS transporter superfamily [Helianthus annuus]|nr:putative MFS transporter superfamily [Helianthus annuus]KAJ0542852.1 putative MFS transporter superfamily [Helianthus annuus]KAJ0711882.1 putative MFS transporter superfamily [Helianthus annuus]KAJ0798624.1 putative MFS transporter superfamily [Helianthus annuus]
MQGYRDNESQTHNQSEPSFNNRMRPRRFVTNQPKLLSPQAARTMKTRRLFGISVSLIIINLAAIMERADENLLPSVYKEVSEAFNAGPSDLGYLTFIRNFVQGLASPMAGILVLTYDRPTVLAMGTLCWALSTGAVGASRYFGQVGFWRAINGLTAVDHDGGQSYLERSELLDRERDSGSIWTESWTAMKAVMKVQTFQIIVLQGLVGSLPWTAMVFFTMWFELIGFDHQKAATLLSLFGAGCSIGSLLGGIIADRLSRNFPHTGRIMCAQFSAIMGIPYTWFLLRIIPQSVDRYHTYAVTLLLMGLTISWNGTACNAPMFAEVVPTKHRTMIYAFDRAFEVSFSSFAAPMVGILAEKIYGYDPKSVDPIAGSPREALALSKGLLAMMAIPFGLCCLFYTPLYWVFRRDRDNVRMATLKEEEMI